MTSNHIDDLQLGSICVKSLILVKSLVINIF